MHLCAKRLREDSEEPLALPTCSCDWETLASLRTPSPTDVPGSWETFDLGTSRVDFSSKASSNLLMRNSISSKLLRGS